MAVVALIALVVIGPKDLPAAMRTVGHWVRKVRLLARDFQSNLDDMIRENELDEARKAVESTKSMRDPSKAIKDTVDPTGDLEKEAKDLEEESQRITTDAKNPGRLSAKPKEEKPKEESKAEEPKQQETQATKPKPSAKDGETKESEATAAGASKKTA